MGIKDIIIILLAIGFFVSFGRMIALQISVNIREKQLKDLIENIGGIPYDQNLNRNK